MKRKMEVEEEEENVEEIEEWFQKKEVQLFEEKQEETENQCVAEFERRESPNR